MPHDLELSKRNVPGGSARSSHCAGSLPVYVRMTQASRSETGMHIRYGTPSDAKMLSELGTKTFFDTFAKDNTPENIQAHLRASFSPDIQLNQLSSPDTVFLIAESENNPIGFAQLVLDSREGALTGSRTLEIRKIYAVQEYIGKGVGRELMTASIREARERGCDSIWLGVWERNPRAIDFYKKWGFREVGTHVFKLGEDPQTDFIMELILV